MKKILLLLTLSILFACCNKEDTPTPTPNPVSQLPPATQTGANTFGCLLDGRRFKSDRLDRTRGLAHRPFVCKVFDIVLVRHI